MTWENSINCFSSQIDKGKVFSFIVDGSQGENGNEGEKKEDKDIIFFHFIKLIKGSNVRKFTKESQKEWQ